jgi:hypothetical protein
MGRETGRSPTKAFISIASESNRKVSSSAHGPDFLHGAPPMAACAAFTTESRMNFANANKFFRKSGCTLVRTLGTRSVPIGMSEWQ